MMVLPGHGWIDQLIRSKVQTLGLTTPLEFNQGDVGMAGGIQAPMNQTSKHIKTSCVDRWWYGLVLVVFSR